MRLGRETKNSYAHIPLFPSFLKYICRTSLAFGALRWLSTQVESTDYILKSNACQDLENWGYIKIH